jgi:hypothetical protein
MDQMVGFMKGTSQYDEPLPLIYVLNNLEKPEFAVDLWELFGSEDNFNKALVGKWDYSRNDFKAITWDWPKSNIKHIFNILYFLSCIKERKPYSQEYFEFIYKSEIKNSTNLIEFFLKFSLERPVNCLYVIRYKKQFPALIIEWEKIEQEPIRKRPLLITFKPRSYFIMDSETWVKAKERAKYETEWIKAYSIPKDQIEVFKNIFSKYVNMKQQVYGLIPYGLLYRAIRRSKIILCKPVERINRAMVIPDTLIFWQLFHEITGAQRERFTIKLNSEYFIKDIPIDALSKESNVYKHEAGVASVLGHVLVEIFGKKYIDFEFKQLKYISYRQSEILKREFQVRNIPGEENNTFGEADYDYALRLRPLGIDAILLVDLTTALWKKGLLSYDEYTERWKEICFNVPIRRKNTFLLWHIVINKTEKEFFEAPSNPKHHNFNEMLKEITSEILPENFIVISKPEDLLQYSGQKVTIMKIFKETPRSKNDERELNDLLENYRRTLFYKTCITVLRYIITSYKIVDQK